MAESDEGLVELPLDGAGTRLRRAREAAGLQLSEIAARTRIAERHLVSIENGSFSAMASRAYAVGFARSYARTVGIDEQEIAQAVRDEMDEQEPNSDRYQPSSFEPGDPARVPSARLAWIAALGAILAVVFGFILWQSFYAPAGELPDPTAEASASAAADALASGSAAANPAAAAQAPVVFTALEQGLWVKFYDAAGNQLMQKQMALGESYTIPPEANGPMIRTARPDALQISVGGQVVAKLSNRQADIKDVPVSAAALLARPAVAAPSAASAPGPSSTMPTSHPTSQGSVAARHSTPSQATTAAITPPSPVPAAPAPTAPAASQSSTVSQ